MDAGYITINVMMPTNITLKCFGCGKELTPDKVVIQTIDITGNEDLVDGTLTATFCRECTYTEGE